ALQQEYDELEASTLLIPLWSTLLSRSVAQLGGRRRGAFAMTSAKDYRDFAIEIGKQASATKDERVRKVLMGAARLWMETALEVERSSALIDDDEPVSSPALS